MPEERQLSPDQVLASLKAHFPEQEIMDFEIEGEDERQGKFVVGETLYAWIVNENVAINMAEDDVRSQLEDQPELFTQEWLKSFIYITDTDRRMIADEEATARMEGMGEDEIIEQAELQDEFNEITEKMSELESRDKEGTPKYQALERAKDELVAKATEALQEKYYDEIYEALEDPVQYFVHDLGIYNETDLLKQNFISINTDEAAEDAVSTDGWEHFLSAYDGDYEETNEGVVYYIVEEDYRGRERARTTREQEEAKEKKEKQTEKWEERWHRRSNIKEQVVVEGRDLLL